MINCIIVDDDLVSINLMKHFISNTEDLKLVESFTNPILALNYIRKNIADINLVFLDVEMPEMTGIEFMEALKELPPIILITSKEKYAVKAFDHKVIHYLVKPVEYGKFLKAVERIFRIYETENIQHLDYIFIKDNGLLSKVNHSEIVYCEALGDYVKVHLKDKSHILNSTMKNLEEKLRLNKQFVRVHRSYIINLNFLENLDLESSIVGGQIIPIGNKYKAGLQARLNII